MEDSFVENVVEVHPQKTPRQVGAIDGPGGEARLVRDGRPQEFVLNKYGAC